MKNFNLRHILQTLVVLPFTYEDINYIKLKRNEHY